MKVIVAPSQADCAGLSLNEADDLLHNGSEKNWKSLFFRARELTGRNFHRKIEFFAPLYYSDYCVNDCVYCSFRIKNRQLPRKALSVKEFLNEAEYLWREGHRALLLVAGEHEPVAGAAALVKYAKALRGTNFSFELAAETGALDSDEYAQLVSAGILRNVLYQETYDRPIYAQAHLSGPKRDFNWRYEAPFRALRAGIQSFGMGVLLGLAPDWKKEILELFRHAADLKTEATRSFFLTFSFPRLRPAQGSDRIPSPVTDQEYEKILALTRVVFPDAGIILSTRETAAFRKELLRKQVGVTHLSAGVSTTVGGYTKSKKTSRGQFDISDERSLQEVLAEAAEMEFISNSLNQSVLRHSASV